MITKERVKELVKSWAEREAQADMEIIEAKELDREIKEVFEWIDKARGE